MRLTVGRVVTTAAATVAHGVVRVVRKPSLNNRIRYRVWPRHPDPNVDPLTLADRIRSTIGPLERALDLPHVHVMVEGHVALLHGDVASADDAAALERAVRRVAGIHGVESHLHVGLLRGDTRPSLGRNDPPPPSAAKRRLLAAARRGGADDAHAPAAVRATLEVLLGRLPQGERDHLLGHLPADVRKMAFPPTYGADAVSDLRTITEFIAAVIAEEPDPAGPATAIVTAILTELRGLVPEEAGDVAAVLPSELRSLWMAATDT
jgi:uncharacterized protein (DUF2267 family)